MEIARLQIAVDSTGARSAQRDLQGLSDQSKKTESNVSSLIRAASGLAIFGTAAAALRTAITASRDFNQAISQLSAITGAAGDDLAFFADQAKEIGRTTTLSASQAAEAFKLIASAKPDLLASRDALALVTKEAVSLAEAAGIQLPDAATALGNSLNQFGADAAEASRFINVLAAGAKFGSSSIADTTLALKASGAAANAVGASFEEANAAIQALAKGGLSGAEAGTNLRNILLKLEADNNTKLRPSVVGVTGAIQNLAKEQLGVTELTKKFGLESVVAAQTLIDNAGAVGKLETALTGTNTAYEQARINNDNLAGDQKALQSATEALAIAFGQKLDPAVRSSTQTMTSAVNGLTGALDVITLSISVLGVLVAGKFTGALAASASALIAQAVAATRATVAVDIHGMAVARTTVAANAAALANRGLAAAMALVGGPVGLAVSGVALLVLGIKSYQERAIMAGKETREFTHSINQMGDAASRAQSRFAGMLAGMQNMTRVELESKLVDLESKLKQVNREGANFQRQFERGIGTQAMIEGNLAAAALLEQEIEKLRGSLNKQATATEVVAEETSGLAKATTAVAAGMTDAQRATEANARVIIDLAESIYQASLSADELAKRQARLTLNEYATPEQIASVQMLAGELQRVEDIAARKKEFGADPAATIRGTVTPLSGGAFDDQAARFDAEREAEELRYAEQLQRTQDAKALNIEVIGGYYALEQQMAQENADRLAQIEQARNDQMLTSMGSAFGQMSSDLMAFSQTFADENSAMFKVAKAAAIAQTIIQTYQGAQQAFTSLSAIPIIGPALGAAAAAAAVAGGMARVSAINSQAAPSFDGGGFTGSGARSGGMDGKGGFLAMMHPNETVLDHTKGQGNGGGGVTINVIESKDKAGQQETRTDADGKESVDVFVSDIYGDGPRGKAIQRAFGLSRVGV